VTRDASRGVGIYRVGVAHGVSVLDPSLAQQALPKKSPNEVARAVLGRN
jgi:hypothetical protein